jgi:hypothetical protein
MQIFQKAIIWFLHDKNKAYYKTKTVSFFIESDGFYLYKSKIII